MMTTASDLQRPIEVPDGRGGLIAADALPMIAAGTMVAVDLDLSRAFYEEFFGFDCVRYAPDRMLIRDATSRRAMEAGSPEFMVIDVQQVPEIVHEQNMLNHWGLTVETAEEVDRIHAAAKSMMDRFGLRKVQKITTMHDAYGFYLADRDMNWWEIEYRVHGNTNNMVFAKGDYAKGGAA